MDVNEAGCRSAVAGAEVEAADGTDRAVSFDATCTGDRISFVGVHSNLPDRAFNELFIVRNFIWR